VFVISGGLSEGTFFIVLNYLVKVRTGFFSHKFFNWPFLCKHFGSNIVQVDCHTVIHQNHSIQCSKALNSSTRF
jgi:hypothetical protein